LDHYSFEIDFDKGLLICKSKNWQTETTGNYDPKHNIEVLTNSIRIALNLVFKNNDTRIQKLMINIIDDITSKVLKPTIDYVDEKLKTEVHEETKKWVEGISDSKKSLPQKEFNNVVDNILNNFYQIRRVNLTKSEKISDLHNKYQVCAYPRV
ncbi:hypothetical protein, partial [Terribacillus saccharophilus]|uniref:hypothetical protein n=1 Tax=Terribacillus saccharophilus TaxID=361277 RepID=UPI000BCE5B14